MILPLFRRRRPAASPLLVSPELAFMRSRYQQEKASPYGCLCDECVLLWFGLDTSPPPPDLREEKPR